MVDRKGIFLRIFRNGIFVLRVFVWHAFIIDGNCCFFFVEDHHQKGSSCTEYALIVVAVASMKSFLATVARFFFFIIIIVAVFIILVGLTLYITYFSFSGAHYMEKKNKWAIACHTVHKQFSHNCT